MSATPTAHGADKALSKLELAEEVLKYFSENIQLTTEILICGSQGIEGVLAKQSENSDKIENLLQGIREQLESDTERQLFEAASRRWAAARRYQDALRGTTLRQASAKSGAAMADTVLPRLVDLASWSAFVQFVRTQADATEKNNGEAARRVEEFLRTNEEIKSKIAERKRIDEKFSQLESIIESSSDAIVIHALDGTIVSWNAGAEKIYGYSASEVLGKGRNTLLAPGQPDELPRTLEMLSRGEAVSEYETIHLRKDGQQIDVSTAISPVKDAEGTIVGVAAISRDMSERKKAEEMFYKAFEANPEPITITTLAEGRYIDVNEGFLRVTGRRRKEIIGRTWLELKFWERADDLAALNEALHSQGYVRNQEITFLTNSGEQRIGLNSAELIEVGGEKCVIAIFRDMTDQKRLEKQLRKAQRMEAIGQLCGGIAHDFNNLLTVLNGHSDLLEDQLDKSHSSFKSAEEIKKAVKHAGALTSQLLAFSRQQMLESKVVDLNAVITDLGKMLRRLIGEDVELQMNLDSQLKCIKADEGQIQQVIINLAVNARDAMPNGGKLSIRTGNVVVDEKHASEHFSQTPGPYVMLEMSDTGMGMDAQTQARMFEPFFTTKEVGKGTGLGLSTVYGVIKQSGGYIWVDSEVGRGTAFRIYLPRTTGTAAPTQIGGLAAKASMGSETVLLVEDADQVHELTRTWLASSGYNVLEARNPEEAIQIAEQHRADIHMLLTDVVMPGMNGKALAEKLSQMRPRMKILYMSGYTGFRDLTYVDCGAMFLQKPFTKISLLGKLREVLAKAGDPAEVAVTQNGR